MTELSVLEIESGFDTSLLSLHPSHSLLVYLGIVTVFPDLPLFFSFRIFPERSPWIWIYTVSRFHAYCLHLSYLSTEIHLVVVGRDNRHVIVSGLALADHLLIGICFVHVLERGLVRHLEICFGRIVVDAGDLASTLHPVEVICLEICLLAVIVSPRRRVSYDVCLSTWRRLD